MSVIRLLWRAPVLVTLVCFYLLLAALAQALLSHTRSRRMIMYLSHRLARLWNYVLNIHIDTRLNGINPAHRYLILANHLSYLDIPIILENIPSLFVTSVEIRDTPGLGLFCRLSACLFVERRRKAQLPADVAMIKQALADGFNVGIFPEGTSSNGEHVLAFRKSLIQAAVGSDVQILPLSIRYERIDGRPVAKQNRDTVCWYGDMSFLPHFTRVLMSQRIDVSLRSGEQFSASLDLDRKALADRAYSEISGLYAAKS
jgi:1-acyl-sn-glycerol-3-phosphate acyltransferase